ncbi:hypothetical protein [Deinococcus altitudinis]|uniref:hypothetical protein n=1 Tax=Deinococcus altitudinis TaxID=468914 RepID=UPI0038926719
MKLEEQFEDARRRLLACRTLPEAFQERGFSLEHLQSPEFGLHDLGLDRHGNGVIAQRDLEGRLLGLKLRLVGAGAARYVERPGPNGNLPWLPPGAREMSAEGQQGVLCIEGELNAMLSFVALRGSDWGVVGLGSAFGPLPWSWLARLGLPVVMFLDRGRAGDKSFGAWQMEAEALRLPLFRAGALLGDWDACEYAAHCGFEALAPRWLQVLRASGAGQWTR